MDIKNIKGMKTKSSFDQNSLESVVAKAHSGNTILFIGAGYSLGCINEKGVPIPLARELSKKICILGKFDEDEDLAFSADYYLKYNEPVLLVNLLKEHYLIKEVRGYHKNISKLDWRRVYTTNYDNCFEFSAGKIGKVVLPITLEDSPATYFRRRDICVHINGSIKLLDNETIENSFKLSESSYTNSDAFSDSSWLYRFKKDLDVCSQIIFIGYSLYDMEVKRLLVGGESIKSKTFFITGEDISTKEHHRLSMFGEVFPIGIEEFGEILSNSVPVSIPESLKYLSSLQKEEISFDADFGDSDIRDFLLRGKVNSDFIASSLTTGKNIYAIKREQCNELLDTLKTTNAIVIYGALANGKSVILKQIIAHLLLEGNLVYTIKDEESDYERDIELLSTLNKIIYLFIDDFERNLDIAHYFSSTLGDNGKLILTERPHRYRRAITCLKGYGIDPYRINIDYLHGDEVKEIAQVISNTGLWGERAGGSLEKQIKYLRDDCESQLLIILLNLLKSPHIISLFETAFSEILKFPNTKKTVHSICIIQHIYPSQCKKSFISDIADSNHVYSSEFEDRIMESGLFEFKRDTLVTRSSVFCTFILSSLYKASYTIDQLVRIARKLQRNRSIQSIEEREIYRSIMTFGTLSSVLPYRNKSNSYIEFYEKLKMEVPSVVRNPHYWLQYAMSVMSENNLSDAERILNTAYSKAENNPDYDTTYIDNQFARLKLKLAIAENEQKESIGFFLEAHKILKSEDNDIYKFRQAGLYLLYYSEKYKDLSRGNKVKFEHAIREILNHYLDFIENEYPMGDIPPFQSSTVGNLYKPISPPISVKILYNQHVV